MMGASSMSLISNLFGSLTVAVGTIFSFENIC
jgi:hypothetical protein